MPNPSPTFVFHELPSKLPAGYAAAALTSDAAPLRLCVVVRTDVKAGVAPFVLLRDMADARVYLGCVVDAMGVVQRWVEIWVQDASGLANAPAAHRQALSNRLLDERWAQRVGALAASGGGVIHCGWEATNPPPILVDAKAQRSVPARDSRSGASWALCRDEGLLSSKGLPGYGATLSRHLCQPELGEQSELIPVDVISADPAALAAALGMTAGVAALNPCAGLMMVTPLAPLGYEEFVDAITGASGESGNGDVLLRSIASSALGGDSRAKAGGWLSLAGVGLSGRLVEALHVKLMLLAGATAESRRAAMQTQSPLLNITGQSFRVALASGMSTVPLWWTARVQLAVPGDAVPLSVPGTNVKYYLPGRGGGQPVYAPSNMGQASTGRGWLRLKNVDTRTGGVILEGTLSTQDRLAMGASDLIWLRLSVGGVRVELHATADAGSSMAAGEVPIRTVAHAMPDAVIQQLRGALGAPIADVMFEVVPLLSTPCDLYALGVLAVRTLLVDGRRPLAEAMDHVLSLVGAAAKEIESGVELPGRIAGLMEGDKRFADSLGPQRLLAESTSSDAAMEAIPPRLWYGTLAFVVRLFSGLSPDSRCRDLGHAPAGAEYRVFDGPLEDLYALLAACRALIVPDHALNSEVQSVLRECLAAAKR